MSAVAYSGVARTVFPMADAEKTMALYIDGDASPARVVDRGSVAVAPGGDISLGSYFNAFPASYWAAQSHSNHVRLTVDVAGRGSASVFRSDAEAQARPIDRRAIDGRQVLTFDLPLAGFEDGGAYWFDLAADAAEVVLHTATWSVPSADLRRASATVAMATFNRPQDCVAQLSTLAGDAQVWEAIDRIVVVDQGTDLIADHPDFAGISAKLGERLLLVRQPNMGGSGGFSRGMLETLRAGESTHVLLLDDDAISEPEAIVRAVRFAGAARTPVIVGGGMIHLDNRSVLYAQSEQWNRRIGWVRLERPGAYDHDFAASPFRESPYFHRHQVSDFNGWWMCLIPVSLLERAGLSLPLFLKGDDVEFGLRAQTHHVETISVPGIALWHMGWGGKAPTRTWESYFLHRNRLITELMHAASARPTGLIVHSFLGDMKPLLTLQYSAVRLRAQAIADVLEGPDRLSGWLETRAGHIRSLWSSFTDAVARDAEDGAGTASAPPAPTSRAAGIWMLLTVLARHFLRRSAPDAQPLVYVPSKDLGWWTFAHIDGALVETADGRHVARYRRVRAESRQALARSVRLHLRLWWRWPRLTKSFRESAARLASPDSWDERLRP